MSTMDLHVTMNAPQPIMSFQEKMSRLRADIDRMKANADKWKQNCGTVVGISTQEMGKVLPAAIRVGGKEKCQVTGAGTKFGDGDTQQAAGAYGGLVKTQNEFIALSDDHQVSPVIIGRKVSSEHSVTTTNAQKYKVNGKLMKKELTGVGGRGSEGNNAVEGPVEMSSTSDIKSVTMGQGEVGNETKGRTPVGSRAKGKSVAVGLSVDISTPDRNLTNTARYQNSAALSLTPSPNSSTDFRTGGGSQRGGVNAGGGAFDSMDTKQQTQFIRQGKRFNGYPDNNNTPTQLEEPQSPSPPSPWSVATSNLAPWATNHGDEENASFDMPEVDEELANIENMLGQLKAQEVAERAREFTNNECWVRQEISPCEQKVQRLVRGKNVTSFWDGDDSDNDNDDEEEDMWLFFARKGSEDRGTLMARLLAAKEEIEEMEEDKKKGEEQEEEKEEKEKEVEEEGGDEEEEELFQANKAAIETQDTDIEEIIGSSRDASCTILQIHITDEVEFSSGEVERVDYHTTETSPPNSYKDLFKKQLRQAIAAPLEDQKSTSKHIANNNDTDEASMPAMLGQLRSAVEEPGFDVNEAARTFLEPRPIIPAPFVELDWSAFPTWLGIEIAGLANPDLTAGGPDLITSGGYNGVSEFSKTELGAAVEAAFISAGYAYGEAAQLSIITSSEELGESTKGGLGWETSKPKWRRRLSGWRIAMAKKENTNQEREDGVLRRVIRKVVGKLF